MQCVQGAVALSKALCVTMKLGHIVEKPVGDDWLKEYIGSSRPLLPPLHLLCIVNYTPCLLWT